MTPSAHTPARWLPLALLAGTTLAQPTSPTPPTSTPAPAPANASATNIDPNAQAKHALATARLIARVASADLRLSEDPQPEDYEITELILSLATDLAPDDAELLRRRIEAAYNAGLTCRVLELTGKLVKLDPADTVAQLRLITAGINRKQTAADRLALYEAFTGPKATAIDVSVRSRLALDGALLARESGDHAAFRKFLTLAATLDVTNKEAAMLALQTFQAENPDDVEGRFELLINLLMSDPLDGLVHLTIANELAAHGVFEHAERAHRNGLRLLNKAGIRIPNSAGEETLVLKWQKSGPKSVLDQLNKDLSIQRENIRRYNESVRDTGIGIGKDYGAPEDLRLPSETEAIRLATAVAAEDAEATRASLDDMTKQVQANFEMANDDKKRPFGITKAEALDKANGSLLDLQFWRVMANLDVDKVEGELAKFEGEHGLNQPGPDMVRAILLIRQGKSAEGLEALTVAGRKLPPGTLLDSTIAFMRGLAAENEGHKEEALKHFRETSRQVPMLPVGALARGRIVKLSGTDAYSEHQAALTRLAAQIPEWVDKAIDEPKSFVTLLSSLPPTGDAIAGETLRITLRNVSPIPLSLGTDRPINTRFLVAPVITGRAATLSREARPEVLEGDRRLRLLPRETLIIEATPSLGFTGMLAELAGDQQLRMSWKVVQGFVGTQSGTFQPGPNCMAADSGVTTRVPFIDSNQTAATLANSLADATGQSLQVWLHTANKILYTPELTRIRTPAAAAPAAPKETPKEGSTEKPATAATPPSSPASTPPEPPPSDAEAATIANALAARYPKLTPADRLLVIAMAPHRGQFPAFEVLDKLARDDADPAVRALATLTRVREADDPSLAASAASTNARLKRIAELQAARLATTARTYSRIGPGLAALRGETPASP